jgi:hypothetical protein
MEVKLDEKKAVTLPEGMKIPKITDSTTFLKLELKITKGRMKALYEMIASLEYDVSEKEKIIAELVNEYFIMKKYYEGEIESK